MTPNIHNCVNTLKSEKRIRVSGYKGFWSVIDDHEGYVLLEHNTYGDESCYLVFKAKDFIWKEITLKSREELIEILKQIDFKRLEETHPFLDKYKGIIADFKREEESNEA